jgi:hypothetical protein
VGSPPGGSVNHLQTMDKTGLLTGPVYHDTMRRAAPTIPVTPVMLRHFAVVTVAITGCIAMFADGENREFIEDQLKARQAKTMAMRADAQKGSKLKTVGGLRIAKGTKLDNSSNDSPGPASAPDTGGSFYPDASYAEMAQQAPAGAAGLAYSPHIANGSGNYMPQSGTKRPARNGRKPALPPEQDPKVLTELAKQQEIDAQNAARAGRSGESALAQLPTQ